MKNPRELFNAAGEALHRRLLNHDQPPSGQGRKPRENRGLLSGWVRQVPWKLLQQRRPGCRDRSPAAAPFHGQQSSVLTEDLPRWLAQALSEATVQELHCGVINAPVNWQELARKQPAEVQYFVGEVAGQFDELWAWANNEELQPSLAVNLVPEPGGLIGVWRFEFATTASAGQIKEATAIMARRTREPGDHEPFIEGTSNNYEDDKRARWTFYL
ncbi:hypothetical protein [Paenarthrobacter aromaticivorans]|uniref:Uncharacterized protein n=1 Tax=Paenarthrobacter aromaticivorans TaxID=2849150 RepID=A0ABS6I7Y6_9MICC|nr:hypothetical protein [Paenarthrobacter sp. MMS21-TAE1-1]MBU8867838.1 hypothetical protein [Paenarthrobacter sp. MMS21-TAE1-1]